MNQQSISRTAYLPLKILLDICTVIMYTWVVVTTLKSDHIQPLVIGLVVKLLLLRNYRFEKNKVGTDETWITLFKFDEMQRNLEDFQERCDEYQTKESGLSLSCVPEVMIRVGIFSNKNMNTVLELWCEFVR